jgi:hypothetical protein
MDLHWMFHLRAVESLAARCKKVNPACPVIIGGYTATIFAEVIKTKFAVDFIIRGDAEIPFKKLVEHLLAGQAYDGVPNVTGAEKASPQTFSLTADVFSNGDALSAGWFPDYEAIIREGCSGIPFIFIPVARGCHHTCDWCYGSAGLQQALCRRQMVVRSADAVKKDLDICSNDAAIRDVSIIADFFELEMAGKVDSGYVETILSGHYDLDLYFECYNLPSIERLRRLAGCFNRSTIAVSFLRDHGQSRELNDYSSLLSIAQWAGEQNSVRLLVYGDMNNYCFRTQAQKLHDRYGNVFPADDSSWRIVVPYPSTDRAALANQFGLFYDIQKWDTAWGQSGYSFPSP